MGCTLFSLPFIARRRRATIQIEDVPVLGRNDLVVYKRSLVVDPGLREDGFTVDGFTWLPGETLQLTAFPENLGDVSLQNLEIAFYDGDPESGGSEIQRVVLDGWLTGGFREEVTADFTLSAPAAPHTLYAVVDPDGKVADFDRTNNALMFTVGGTELALDLPAGSLPGVVTGLTLSVDPANAANDADIENNSIGFYTTEKNVLQVEGEVEGEGEALAEGEGEGIAEGEIPAEGEDGACGCCSEKSAAPLLGDWLLLGLALMALVLSSVIIKR